MNAVKYIERHKHGKDNKWPNHESEQNLENLPKMLRLFRRFLVLCFWCTRQILEMCSDKIPGLRQTSRTFFREHRKITDKIGKYKNY